MSSRYSECVNHCGFCLEKTSADINSPRQMLDADDNHHCAYYQPGFGTYVSSTWLSQKARTNKAKAWYLKTKGAMIGSTYAEHVMAGYRFLMHYYSLGDSIYIIGFSRGAFIACLVAEMLDHMGLLKAGNEEIFRFAWLAFTNWKREFTKRNTSKEKQDEQYTHMKAFRETFCRQLPQISFLGLFDLVNSVPRIEKRHRKLKLPYKALTSAKVIRHALSIDERRTRFRNDLISDIHPRTESLRSRWQDWRRQHKTNSSSQHVNEKRSDLSWQPNGEGCESGSGAFQQTPNWSREPIPSEGNGHNTGDEQGGSDNPVNTAQDQEGEVTAPDIQEVWFPGTHGDIGGGAKLRESEDWPLSHGPLVWILEEAQRAGLQLDPDRLKEFNCYEGPTAEAQDGPVPQGRRTEDGQGKDEESEFEYALRSASTQGQIHDSLSYGGGVPWSTVLTWKILECFPIRRMHLNQGEFWKPVRWPPPRGERRDIPPDANIHKSAIRRMEADTRYRPANLILGSRRKKGKISPRHGIGGWEVHSNRGSPAREIYRRKWTV